ncbi:hypothetical protein lerEdw1_011198, partial [Lerista edwardsae]
MTESRYPTPGSVELSKVQNIDSSLATSKDDQVDQSSSSIKCPFLPSQTLESDVRLHCFPQKVGASLKLSWPGLLASKWTRWVCAGPGQTHELGGTQRSCARDAQVMNPRTVGAPLQIVDPTQRHSSRWTTFWKVPQEDGESVDSLEGSFSPPLDHPEETFLQYPVESLRLQDQELGGGTQTRLKVKNSQVGGNEPGKRPRRGRRKTQKNVPVTAEMPEKGRESSIRQETEPVKGYKDSGMVPEGLGAACSHPSPVTERGKVSFSKYGRRYSPKRGLVFEHIEVPSEGPPLGEKIQPGSKLGKHHSSYLERDNRDSPDFGVRIRTNSLS